MHTCRSSSGHVPAHSIEVMASSADQPQNATVPPCTLLQSSTASNGQSSASGFRLSVPSLLQFALLREFWRGIPAEDSSRAAAPSPSASGASQRIADSRLIPMIVGVVAISSATLAGTRGSGATLRDGKFPHSLSATNLAVGARGRSRYLSVTTLMP